MCLPSLRPSLSMDYLSFLHPIRSFHLRVSLRWYVLCPELLFILISWAFCFSVVSELRRKYKIIMIIMSHFARNNTVGAGIRRGSRAIRRANNVGRRSSAISRCSADPRSFLRPLLFLLPSRISLSRCPSPFNGISFFRSCIRLRPLCALGFIFIPYLLDFLLIFLTDC